MRRKHDLREKNTMIIRFTSVSFCKGTECLLRISRNTQLNLDPIGRKQIHVVVKGMADDSPEVKPENGHGRIPRLHRNLLTSCNQLPVEPVLKRRKRRPR